MQKEKEQEFGGRNDRKQKGKHVPKIGGKTPIQERESKFFVTLLWKLCINNSQLSLDLRYA